MAPRERLRFGLFELDASERTLSRDGRRIAFQEKPFEALALLLSRAGEVVSREELEQALWGGAFVDAEHGINTAIHKVREALGDDAHNPRFVATVARRGYRFIAPVDRADAGALAAREASPAALSGSGRPRRGLLAVLVAGAVVVLALAAWHRAVPGAPRAAIRAVAVLPFDDLSPEGSQSHLATWFTELLITDLARTTGLRVTSPASATEGPVWPPQGRLEGHRTAEISRELEVQALVQGAISRTGGTLHVTVQLVDPATDDPLWADRFDDDQADLPRLERRVASAIARQMRSD